MKTAEQAAEEYAIGCLPTLLTYEEALIAEDGFLAGDANAVERMQSIWKKPSERPEVGPMLYIVVKDYRLVRGHFNSFDEKDWDEACVRDEVKTWAYLSDLLSLLPDWAKEEQK